MPEPHTSYLPRPRRGSAAGSRRARPALEVLEDRNLLAAALDSTFNEIGKFAFANFPGATLEGANAVAVQSDGKILVASVGGSAGPSILMRLFPDGSIDTSFGVNGQAAVQGVATSVLVQPDGQILVGGFRFFNGGKDFLASRFTTAGAPDLGFGLLGVAVLAGGGEADAMALQSNGEVVLAGSTFLAASSDLVFGVGRLHANGLVDTGFGSNGLALASFSSATNLDLGRSVVIQPDGRIVMAGWIGVRGGATLTAGVARFNTDGTPDNAFAGTGRSTANFFIRSADANNTSFGLAVQPDGNILLGGFNALGPTNDFAASRLTASGAIDTSFGTAGLTLLGFNLGGFNDDRASSLLLQPDGKILLVGFVGLNSVEHEMAVARLNSNGSPDLSFNPNGEAVIDFDLGGVNSDVARAAVLQPDGKIVVAGSATGPSGFLTAVARMVVAPQTSTVGVFDPSTASWYLRNGNSAGVPNIGPFSYGARGWVPVTGDWSGDGKTTVGVVDPRSETWYLRDANSAGGPTVPVFAYGAPGWIPVVGDWDGEGTTTVGAYDAATATWYLRNENSAGAPDAGVFRYGAPGWLPVVGDWNGDGRTTIGVFDPASATFYLRNQNNAGGADAVFRFGNPGWIPVAGNWNGSNATTIGVVDPSASGWYLRNSNSAGPPNFAPFAYGLPGWRPVTGDWSFPALAELADPGAAPDPGDAAALGQGQLQAAVSAALARLSAAAADPALVSRLASARFAVGALPEGDLGLAYVNDNRVVIRAGAAGFGWFVDPTPLQDEEFRVGTPGSPLTALPGGPAAGKMDLLTVVLHEMGHLAGRPDQDGPANGAGLMADALAPGVRRTEALDAVFAQGP